jgi:hypothetical protein
MTIRISELIAALACASGGSDELDGEIHFAVMQPRWQRDPPPPGAIEKFKRSAPRYTASLDVAITAVPEGRAWRISSGLVNVATGTFFPGQASASVETADERWSAFASTPALALCMAALRAREAGVLHV